MRIICAWCNKLIKEGSSDKAEETSHGMCESCLVAFDLVTYSFKGLQEFLNTLETPVLSSTDDGVILAINEAAARVLGKSTGEVTDQYCGVVISCANADLPGGCGDTPHCSGCAIRNCITHTMETGESLDEVDAYMPMKVDGQNIEMIVPVSTRKSGDVVVLRIGQMRRSHS